MKSQRCNYSSNLHLGKARSQLNGQVYRKVGFSKALLFMFTKNSLFQILIFPSWHNLCVYFLYSFPYFFIHISSSAELSNMVATSHTWLSQSLEMWHYNQEEYHMQRTCEGTFLIRRVEEINLKRQREASSCKTLNTMLRSQRAFLRSGM